MSARRSSCVRMVPAAVVAAALALPAAAAEAQSSGDGFLFGRPRGTFTLRAGYDQARAGGDLFGDITQRLTLGRSAFGGAAVGGELAFGVARAFDVAFGAGFVRAERGSEFRNFIDDDDAAIRQTTTFLRVPLSASVKAYLGPRGRSVGSLAWVPARFTPFVGAGGGAVWYRLQQQGAFVDEGTLDVFDATLSSSGWAPSAHAFAGADVSLSPRFVASAEARYTHARRAPGGRFTGYDRIDLSGLAVTAGIGVRF